MGVPLANARVGVLRATLSLRCFALLTHPPHASRKLRLDFLSCLYTYLCFILFNVHYQLLTRLKFFALFELCSFYLVLA
ncbi:MAG: hypothetical protein NZ455_02285 [Bacteroidia bacterium]|nr:hypothetical protein [Bacteroidia bacterium]